MLIEQGDGESLSKEQCVFDLSKKEAVYRMVFYTMVSPRELDENLVITLERPEPITQEEKREAKIAELDAYKEECLKAYNELCALGVYKYNFAFLMENGFGLGASDLFDDEAIDELIAKDEQIERQKTDTQGTL